MKSEIKTKKMKNSILLKPHTFSALLLLMVTISSCAPIFSDLQDARLVGKNNVEATAGYSAISFKDDSIEGDGIKVQNEISVMAAYGLSKNFDVRLRYTGVWLDNDVGEGSASILSFGPKVKLVENYLALYMPIGFGFGSEINNTADTWQIHPTLLGTIPVIDQLDINPSFKVLFPFEDRLSTLVAVNLGLGIKVLNGLTIRPEFGLLFDPGEDGNFKQFTIGATYFPKFKNGEER